LKSHQQNYCLATVVTPSFVLGGLVLIHSFLRTNPWFRGDVVIIHDELSQEHMERFSALHEQLTFMQVSQELKSSLGNFKSQHPTIMGRLAQFFNFEIFRLQKYEKLLFCDSDMLFLDSVEELFGRPEPLIACGDGPHYRSNGRNRHTFDDAKETDDNPLRRTFNAGFMLFDRSVLNNESYQKFLSMLESDYWMTSGTRHTDQAAFNIIFEGSQTLVGGEYNYLLIHKKTQFQAEQQKYHEAKVLHYNGTIKPWKPEQTASAGRQDEDLAAAFQLWNVEYAKCLQKLKTVST